MAGEHRVPRREPLSTARRHNDARGEGRRTQDWRSTASSGPHRQQPKHKEEGRVEGTHTAERGQGGQNRQTGEGTASHITRLRTSGAPYGTRKGTSRQSGRKGRGGTRPEAGERHSAPYRQNAAERENSPAQSADITRDGKAGTGQRKSLRAFTRRHIL